MRQQTTAEVQGSIQGQEKALYHISEGAEIHIMRILRNMYSDPLKAVLREYLANALDAHNEVNIRKPIKINLPGSLKNNLTIRDYGPSLTNEEFQKYILGYGETGDFKFVNSGQIGGFGIGCKSFFAISSTAIYTLYRDGYETVWICQPDKNDQGTANMISKEPSDEPDGCQIDIPIDPIEYDHYTTQTKLNDIIRFLDYPLLIDGELYDTPLTRFNEDAEKTLEMDLNGVGKATIYAVDQVQSYYSRYTSSTSWNDPIILINGIPYNLNARFYVDSIIKNEPDAEDFLKKLLSRNRLIINAPDNMFELAPNREAFIENEKSADACIQVHKLITMNINASAEKILRDCEDEKSCLLNAHQLNDSGLYNAFTGKLSSDLFYQLPYKQGTFCLAENNFVKAEDLEALEGVYLAGFTRSTGFSRLPHKGTSCILPVEDLIKAATIHGITEVSETQGMMSSIDYHNLCLCAESKPGYRGWVCKSIRQQQVDYEDHHGLLFPEPVHLYNIPKDKTVNYWAARFIKYREVEYPGVNKSGYYRSSPSSGKSEPYSDIPLFIVHGSEADAKKILKTLGGMVQYKGDLVEQVKKYPRAQPSQTKKKGGTGSTALRSNKPVETIWYKLKEPYRYMQVHSQEWEPTAKPKGKFLYEIIDKFEVLGSDNPRLWGKMQFLRTVAKVRTPCLDAVYAVKLRNQDKVPAKGIRVSDYYNEVTEEWLDPAKKDKFAVNCLQFMFIKEMASTWHNASSENPSFMSKFLELIRLYHSSIINRMFTYEQHPLHRVVKIYEEMMDMPKPIRDKLKDMYDETAFFKGLAMSAPNETMLEVRDEYKKWCEPYMKTVERLINRYPYLDLILKDTTGHGTQLTLYPDGKIPEQLKQVLTYIRSMDRENNRKFSN